MAMSLRSRTFVLVAAASLAAADASAQSVQLAPFAGYQFGGSFQSPVLGVSASLKSSLAYGGTADFAIGENWRVEVLYSRQPTEVRAGDSSIFDLNVERYMGGIVEEKGEGRTRFFGVALGGITRFAPGLGGFDSESRFTLGVGLGLKHFLSHHFGLRTELRGFYTFTEVNGGVFCSGGGTCLFVFGGHGLWQGDVSGGVILAF
jgi:hypothetical protein